MANTTNYNWETPDDTDLVKDGAAAIRTLGSSIDTTTKNLNPSTTLGDIEYRSATANVNTRLPLGTAGQVLKVNSGATAPEWATDSSGMTNPMTTTGDTIYSSSGSTPARLAIGSTGNVLTVAGGVPTWAAPAGGGGLTLLSTTTLSGATTTISSISGSYKDLYVVVRSVVNSASFEFRVKFNSATDKFYGTLTSMTDSALNGFQMTGTEHLRLAGSGAANDIFDGSFYITQYASGTYKKSIMGSFVNYYQSSKYANNNSAVSFYDTTAISSLTFSPSSGTFSSGTILLYGVS